MRVFPACVRDANDSWPYHSDTVQDVPRYRIGRLDVHNRKTTSTGSFWSFSEVRKRPLLKRTTGSNGSRPEVRRYRP